MQQQLRRENLSVAVKLIPCICTQTIVKYFDGIFTHHLPCYIMKLQLLESYMLIRSGKKLHVLFEFKTPETYTNILEHLINRVERYTNRNAVIWTLKLLYYVCAHQWTC